MLAGTISALATLLIAAAVMAVVAVNQRDNAVRERFGALSRQLVAQSQSLEEEQPNLARQLLLQAYRFSPTEQALGALIRSPQLPQEIALEDAQSAMATSPTAPIIASVEDGQLAVRWLSTGRSWDVGGVPPVRPDAGLAFSPDGETLAVTDAGALALYGVEAEDNSLRPLGRTALPSVDARRVAFRTDEPIVVVQGADGLTFIDVTDRRAPRMLTRVSNRRRSGPEVTLTDAGAILATPSARLPAAMPVPATVTSLAGQADDDPLTGSPTALSPDGLLLAVGGSRDDVTVWDIADPRAPEPRASLAGESRLRRGLGLPRHHHRPRRRRGLEPPEGAAGTAGARARRCDGPRDGPPQRRARHG